jgi:tetratricopeptide (TPR) repeat protein
MASLRHLVGAAAVLGVLAAAGSAHAVSPDEAVETAQQSIQQYRTSLANIQSAMQRSAQPERTAAQRLADGDLLLRTKDYERAAMVYSQIIEKFQGNGAAYAEASFALGECYYLSGQMPSARRVYTRVVEEGSSGRMAAYKPRALARLTDIALRTRDLEALDELYRRIGEASSGTTDSVLLYARGRVLLAKKDLAGAKSSFQSVASDSLFHHQAKYLSGVVALREARAAVAALPEKDGVRDPRSQRTTYAPAIEAFRQVTRLSPDTDEHKHVIDLGWLAVGRLLYETDQWTGAIDAYNHVGRESLEFGNALFELASVYVQMGDAHRAQRALEVLAVVDPSGAQAAEASLLRGDLELRSGQFNKALATFEGVRTQFGPMGDQVDTFLRSTSDPAVYYDKLVEDQLAGAEATSALPPVAIRWAREAENGPEAFAVVDEVVQTRTLLRQSDELVQKLTAIMNSSGRSKAFPELRAGQQAAIGAINGLMQARVLLAKGLDQEESSNLSGEIDTVRRERRALQEKVINLPVTPADFEQRDRVALRRWNRVSQKVQQLQLQVDTLQSVVNALRRVMKESAARGVVRDPASAKRFDDELNANERDIAQYRQRIDTLRRSTDQGRIASGFDDKSMFDDDSVRDRYKQLLAQEVELASRGAAGGSAASYARRIAPLLQSADQVEDKVTTALMDINQRVDRKTQEILVTINAEQSKIADYGARLELLDQEARLVVGEVAMRNFGLVRDRLRAVVLRADVGITEEAWEAREEQLIRVRSLQTERARSERLLNEELREVLDDAVDQ